MNLQEIIKSGYLFKTKATQQVSFKPDILGNKTMDEKITFICNDDKQTFQFSD